MGYYTSFELTFKPYKDDELPFIPGVTLYDELKKMNVFEDIYIEKDNPFAGDANGYAKWYEHEEDMDLLSKKFVGVLFELHGNGELNDDMWIEYFLNGKHQRCAAKITFDPFNEDEMEFDLSSNGREHYSYEQW